MADQRKDVYYLGQDPFSGKLIKALFLKKGIQVRNPTGRRDSYRIRDVLLADGLNQLIEDRKLTQVLLSNHPARSPLITYWCKTPLNEVSVENILFFSSGKQNRLAKSGALHFSTRKVEDFVGKDDAGLKEVISEFIDNLHTNYRTLYHAVEQNDFPEVRETAHKMMSSVSYYEVTELVSVLKLLEDETSQLDPNNLHDVLQDLFTHIRMLNEGLINHFF